MRVFLVVIDSFGIGAMPDADKFGDAESDTYGNICRSVGVSLPTLVSLGLNNIDGVAKEFGNGAGIRPVESPRAAYARLQEKTFAKDTTAGHYEIAGLVLRHPYRIYKKFPPDVVADLERAAGTHFIGNEVASGTEIIQRLGPEHLRTGCPILYTSQDSVLQIAADTSIVPLGRQYEICEAARRVMVGERAVGRVIARPFIHENGKFIRTEDRKDYALEPPGETMLDVLSANHVRVLSVGKIYDLFCGRGIAEGHHTGNNAEGLETLSSLVENLSDGFVFVNLVDTDMLYGHRNNAKGYAAALEEIDGALARMLPQLRKDDVFIVTADHGCDPTTASTDHSREYVPLLIFGDRVRPQNLGTLLGFDNIAKFVCALYGLNGDADIYEKIMR
ncbi:MAG TPA: phosphopentomutase [Candidatus Borkfalkia excrementipullorum]|nr:phosphopentomutase [Candidatus Borkfalkia excrementipullorum]